MLLTAGLFLFQTSDASEAGETSHFLFKPLNEYIEKMEDPRRAEWQMPGKIVGYLQIKTGDKVADIGAGTGYFTVLFSKRVGDSGKVYAIDVEKRMLEYIGFRARKTELNNIEYILAAPGNPLLPDAPLDMIFICNTFLYLEKKDPYLKMLKDALQKNGKLAIIDFRMMVTPGPEIREDLDAEIKEEAPGAPPLNKRISRERVLEDVLKAGFKLEAEYYFLPYQYFLIFTK